MNFHSRRVITIAAFCAFTSGILVASTEPDPYARLKLYEGSWQINISVPDKKSDHLVNRCARTGTFFSCEQELNGKTAALVIFLPLEHSGASALEYRTLAVLPDAAKPGDWNHLVIDGNTWTYSWTQKDGGSSVEMRNVNHFLDNDHIHFELQKRGDDGNWTTQLAGDESRTK
jgi:hypothetical protein